MSLVHRDKGLLWSSGYCHSLHATFRDFLIPFFLIQSYNEVVVANVPARGDRFIAPDPTKSWLEMYAQEADAVCPLFLLHTYP